MLVGVFNKEKILAGAFSMIVKTSQTFISRSTGDRRKCSPAPDGVKLGVKIEVTPGNCWNLLVSAPLPFITRAGGVGAGAQ